MQLNEEGMHEEIWKEEFSVNSESEISNDSDRFVKFWSGSTQSYRSDEDNVNVTPFYM
jgi:hypothetical protein